LGEHIRRRAAKFQRRLRRDRLNVRDAAHAVGPKNSPLFSHGLN